MIAGWNGLPGRSRIVLRLGPELGQGPGQQSGDVHLTDPEPSGDLRLGQALEEPQVQDHALPGRELGDEGRQGDPVLAVDEALVLAAQLGRSPTIGEIAQSAAVSEEEVLEAIEAGHAYRFTSLDAPSGNDDEMSLSAELGSEDQGLIDSEHRVTLSPLIAQFPPRERMILHLRFFEGLTQSEIAGRLGISQMHVSRLLARALAQLRTQAEDDS